jgi:carboxypeptidase PM20D1
MRARRVGLWATGLSAALALVVLGRTLAYAPEPPIALPVALSEPIPIDVDRAARRLSEAIRFPTVSHANPAEDDPLAWRDLRTWLTSTYVQFNAAAKRRVFGGALLFTWTGSAPALPPMILMAHQDVAPVNAQSRPRWTVPPFDGAIRNGAVWGRGALDDKGALVAIMEACETLAARGFRPKRTVLIVLGDHEETTGGGVDALAADLQKADVHALFVLDQGLSIVDEAPITGKPAALIGVAQKGDAALKLVARGDGGSVAAPPASSAALSIARAVAAIANRPFPLALAGPTQGALRALSGQAPFFTRLAAANSWLFGPWLIRVLAATPDGAALLHTTLVPTELQGSQKADALPATASALIAYGLFPGDTAQGAMRRARRAVRGLAVDLRWAAPPHDPPPTASVHAGAYRVIAALVRTTQHVPVAPALMIRATDSRRLSPVASDIYDFTPVRLAAADMTRVQGADERITLKNLEGMTEFYARLIATVAAG